MDTTHNSTGLSSSKHDTSTCQSSDEHTITSTKAPDCPSDGDAMPKDPSSITAPPAPTGFEGLPGELRNEIYRHIRPAGYIDVSHYRRSKAKYLSSMAFVNKKIRKECLDFFHETAHFMLRSSGFRVEHDFFYRHIDDDPQRKDRMRWVEWVDSLTEQRANEVRHLVFYSHRSIVKVHIPSEGVIEFKGKGGGYTELDGEWLREEFLDIQMMRDRKEILREIGSVVLREAGEILSDEE